MFESPSVVFCFSGAEDLGGGGEGLCGGRGCCEGEALLKRVLLQVGRGAEPLTPPPPVLFGKLLLEGHVSDVSCI